MNYIECQIKISPKDIKLLTKPGDATENVKMVAKKLYMVKQLANIPKESLVKELKEYGAWDDEELSNHNENLLRWIWICASEELHNHNKNLFRWIR